MKQLPLFTQTLHHNKAYLASISILLMLATISLAFLPKGELLFFFSAQRHPFWDAWFKYGTQLGEPLAYLFFTVVFLFRKWRHAIAIPLLGGLVTITSYLSKKGFGQPRPRQYFSDLGVFDQLQLIEGVKVHGGSNSFPSGHTMSAFALFTFVALCATDKRWSAIGLLGIAVWVGLSRVYLVQHFFQDIVAGAFIGVLLALVWYQFHLTWGTAGQNSWLDRRITVQRRARV